MVSLLAVASLNRLAGKAGLELCFDSAVAASKHRASRVYPPVNLVARFAVARWLIHNREDSGPAAG